MPPIQPGSSSEPYRPRNCSAVRRQLSWCATWLRPLAPIARRLARGVARARPRPWQSEANSGSHSQPASIAASCPHGLPVLTTTATPWQQLAAIEAGWLCAADLTSLTLGLQRALGTPAAQRRAMGLRGRDHVARQLSWRRTAEQFLHLYQQVLRQG